MPVLGTFKNPFKSPEDLEVKPVGEGEGNVEGDQPPAEGEGNQPPAEGEGGNVEGNGEGEGNQPPVEGEGNQPPAVEEGSSLNNDNNDGEGNEPQTLTEAQVLEFLSGKLGQDITSLESLSQPAAQSEPDPYVKALSDFAAKTGKTGETLIQDFIKSQRDVSKLTDEQAAREFLQIEYPSFTKEDIDQEMKKYKMISEDEDLDGDAEEKNAARKLELKKLATKGRAALEELKKGFELPEEGYTPGGMTEDVKQKLEAFKQIQDQFAQNQKAAEDYNIGIANAAKGMSTLPIKLSDDLSIDFKLSEEQLSTLPETMNEMAHWYNEDGSTNFQAVVSDAIKAQYLNDIVKLAFEQGKSVGAEEVIDDGNNITLGNRVRHEGNNGKGKGPELLDKPVFMNGPKMTIGKKK